VRVIARAGRRYYNPSAMRRRESEHQDSVEGPVAGEWAFIASLGSSCAVAYHLHRRGLVRRTGPLDWMGCWEPDGLCRLLTGGFDGFMDRANLRVTGTHGDSWEVWDTVHGIRSIHDFKIRGRRKPSLHRPNRRERLQRLLDRCSEPVWRWWPPLRFSGPEGRSIALPRFRSFRRQIGRRVARFMAAVERPGPLLLVRNLRKAEEPPLIRRALNETSWGLHATLLVLFDHPDLAGSVDLPGVVAAPHPPPCGGPFGWRGRDEAWDQLFEKCRLAES
jgi:hypothetical protein